LLEVIPSTLDLLILLLNARQHAVEDFDQLAISIILPLGVELIAVVFEQRLTKTVDTAERRL